MAAGTIVFALPACVGRVEVVALLAPVEPAEPVALAVVGALAVFEAPPWPLLVCGVPVLVVSPVALPVPVPAVEPAPVTPVEVVLTGVEDGVPAALVEPGSVGVAVPVPSALGADVAVGAVGTGVAVGLFGSVRRGGVPGP